MDKKDICSLKKDDKDFELMNKPNDSNGSYAMQNEVACSPEFSEGCKLREE